MKITPKDRRKIIMDGFTKAIEQHDGTPLALVWFAEKGPMKGAHVCFMDALKDTSAVTAVRQALEKALEEFKRFEAEQKANQSSADSTPQ